jgi:hypothetical protein
MGKRLRKTVALLAFTAFSTAALADDPPARVGRVALAQGQVSISQDGGQPPTGVQVNWPVTSHNTITTAPGARTELRIGSTSVRLDGGSSLELTELDDDNLRLRLHYGSASVRIVNADVVEGFELVTPQARVRMQQPGRIRIDAERVVDTSTVQVFDGQAVVEGGGSEMSLRAGRRADLRDDELRTAQAQRDAFDDWSYGRDQYEDRSQSTRYVASEVTGYEDLDRYGSWSTDAEYGSVWAPTTVGADWVPYRDGSWTWIEPWGWTWVDNAPWGYAPFHYGRWVVVNHRWCWAPGHIDRRPVWAPALVGWIGGSGWHQPFHGQRNQPATGWYPLAPHERYVPGYRAPESHLRWWNRNVHTDDRRDHGRRPQGVTVVPHDAFGHRDRIDVRQVPKGAPPPVALQRAPGSAPPPPPDAGRHDRWTREHDGRDERRADGQDRFGRDRDGRGGRVPVLTAPSQPRQPITTATPPPGQVAAQPRPPVAAAPAPSFQDQQPQDLQGPHGRRDGREAFEDGRRRRPLETDGFPFRRQQVPVPGTTIASPPMQNGAPPAGTSIASPPMQMGAPPAGTSIASPPMQMGAPAAGTSIASPPMQRGAPPAGTSISSPPPSQPPAGFAPRFERHRGDGDGDGGHRGREQGAMESRPAPAPVMAAQPVSRPPQPAPMPAAQPMPVAAAPRPMSPPPAAAPAPAPAQHAAPQSRGDRGGRDGNVRQQER